MLLTLSSFLQSSVHVCYPCQKLFLKLIPLVNRPDVYYVIKEAIAAGIKHIVLVGHAQKSATENYFDLNAELDNQLRANGKEKLADSLNWLPHDNVLISIISQSKLLGIGYAQI